MFLGLKAEEADDERLARELTEYDDISDSLKLSKAFADWGSQPVGDHVQLRILTETAQLKVKLRDRHAKAASV